MNAFALLRQVQGAAAAEMALLLPVVMLLLFGGFESGHFIWTQHKLTEAVRNGARYAARLPVELYCIDGGAVVSGATITTIKNVTRTGDIAGIGTVAVPSWSDAQVDVHVDCGAFVDTGIYEDLGMAAPIVTVEATGVAYPSLFGRLGVIEPSITMTAKSSAAVTGL